MKFPASSDASHYEAAGSDGNGPFVSEATQGGPCKRLPSESIRKKLRLTFAGQALSSGVREKREAAPTPKLLDGTAEAKLIALRLGKPPAGFGHWTLRLLADQMVELEIVESISPETVRQTLKKMA